MGKMETASRKRGKKVQVEAVILSSLALAGVGLMAIAAPNCLQLLKRVDPDWIIKRDPKSRVREAAYRLKTKGFVEFKREPRGLFLRLTPKGRTELGALILRGPLPRPKHWDGKWRLVIFDIAEKKRAIRVRARAIMATFGFVRLQDSVWAYPYDCEEAISLLKTELGLGKELLYIIADAIEFDQPLRAAFNLPLE